MRLILGFAALVLVSGCAIPPEPEPPSGPQACDAADAQELIGSHVGAVTFAPDKNVRIVCTTCPTTRDYRPDRLNVRFDQTTGQIEKIDCG